MTSAAISGANNISGLLQFDGKSAVTANWFTITTNATGQYSVNPRFGSTTITDSAGNVTTLQFIVTALMWIQFPDNRHEPVGMFTGSGRTESTTAPCSASTLNGVYSLVVTGRNVSAFGVLTMGTLQSTGSATLDGAGNAVLSLTANTNLVPRCAGNVIGHIHSGFRLRRARSISRVEMSQPLS